MKFTAKGLPEGVTFDAAKGILGGVAHWVKDLWRQQCEGKHAGTYVVEIPPHATKLIYVKPVNCSKCE